MKKNTTYQRAALGVLVLISAFGLFAKRTHAQTLGTTPVRISCTTVNGNTYAFGNTCINGGTTCKANPCPPTN